MMKLRSLISMSALMITVLTSVSNIAMATEVKDEKLATLEGRIVEVNGEITFRESGKQLHDALGISEVRVEPVLKEFLGQIVTIQAELNSTWMLNVMSLVTAKNSLIRGKVGQGVYVQGTTSRLSETQYRFLVIDKKMQELIGQEKLNLKTDRVLPDTYRAEILGVISGQTLVMNNQEDAFKIMEATKNPELGDYLIIHGKPYEAVEQVKDRISNSGLRGNYFGSSATEKMTSVINGQAYIYRADGELIPATTPSSSWQSGFYVDGFQLKNESSQELFFEVEAENTEKRRYGRYDGHKDITAIGQVISANALRMTDARPFVPYEEIHLEFGRPGIVKSELKVAGKAVTAKPIFSVIQGGLMKCVRVMQ